MLCSVFSKISGPYGHHWAHCHYCCKVKEKDRRQFAFRFKVVSLTTTCWRLAVAAAVLTQPVSQWATGVRRTCKHNRSNATEKRVREVRHTRRQTQNNIEKIEKRRWSIRIKMAKDGEIRFGERGCAIEPSGPPAPLEQQWPADSARMKAN